MGVTWYGNALVQAFQFFVFAVVFLVGAVAGTVGMVRKWHRDQTPSATRLRKWLALRRVGSDTPPRATRRKTVDK